MAVYLLALVLCFHEILLHPGSRLTGFGDGSATLRDYWAASVQHRDPFNLTLDRTLAAPGGTIDTPATVLANGGIQTAFVWELRGALGLIGAWNAFMLIGFMATALAMFALLRWLGCTLPAALLGGYVFGFSPYALERAYAGHLSFVHNWIYVGLAALLLRLDRRPRTLLALLVGGGIAVAFYLSAYTGLLAGFMVAVFFAVELARRRASVRRTLGLAALAYASGLLLMAPIFVLYSHEHSAVISGTSHSTGDLYYFAASWGAYLVPSPRNPLFHWVRGFHPSDLTEETLYFGYTTLALAIAALVLLRRGERWLCGSSRRRSAVIFFAVLVPAALLFSLPPSYNLGGLTLPMPSKAIGLLSPIWRVYSRFGLIVGLALVVLAALGLSALAQRPGRAYRLLTPLVAAVVFLELLPAANRATFDASAAATPAWVTWLASAPRGIVASYPWLWGHQQFEDEWYQVDDRDPQFDLYPNPSSDVLASRSMGIRVLARDVQTPLAASVLATEGVRYVVLHDVAYQAGGQRAPTLGAPDYRLLSAFPGVQIYAVHAPHIDIARALAANATSLAPLQGIGAPNLSVGSGFNAAEPYKGGTGHWMIQDGQIELAAGSGPVKASISGFAFANGTPRTLTLLGSGGRVLATLRIPTFGVQFSFGPFALPAGTTTLTLVASPGPAQLGPSDPRQASVFLAYLTTTAIPPYIGGARSP